MKHRILWLGLTSLILSACSQTSSGIHQSNQFANNGLDHKARAFNSTYKLQPEAVLNTQWLTPQFLEGLERQLNYLNKKSVPQLHTLPGLAVSKSQLQQTIRDLQAWAEQPSAQGGQAFALHQLAGEDGKGNVQFTGYYVPVFKVRSRPDAEYKYPIYRKPAGLSQYPSREEIDFEQVLAGQGLELFYSNSLVDNFFMQVQGSGVVEDEYGQQHLLSYGGGNGHSYRSLGKVLIEMGEYTADTISATAIKEWLAKNPDKQRELMSKNPSYTFFSPGLNKPVGAANEPLTPLHSVAVDPAFIPLGSIVLAQVPLLDDKGDLTGHEFRLMLAQDKGAAIKTPGRIDVYQGIGDEAQQRSDSLRHYGKIWLVLAKGQSH
ncbi:MAG: murein transglycosylase A [Gammaproteobacteria bacterium]|nr:murein transglycosylase A [Gammaproteobacteria bacterium]MBU2057161.1 murein transglycosylase A [Gammaproteobacteria bacterium]MBU2174988.1 murein transglycosylase A [Gammaproteobacteria bacterium]MBU2246249.1 murein transglycosylase A [Gammaproteobacteria bacterium]MBU2346132.1 murein transglycosylase A [Gammaproteobacteria bacterium]